MPNKTNQAVLIRSHETVHGAGLDHHYYRFIISAIWVGRCWRHVFSKVAHTMMVPPVMERAPGRSPWRIHVQTGFIPTSSWRVVIASKAGTWLRPRVRQT